MIDEQERADFEAMVIKTYGPMAGAVYLQQIEGHYTHSFIQHDWTIWQAAHRAPSAAPEPRPQYDWCPECHARDSMPEEPSAAPASVPDSSRPPQSEMLASVPGWVLVDAEKLRQVYMMIDPPPIERKGKMHVFVDPNAARNMTRISAAIRDLVEARPTAPAQPEPAAQDKRDAEQWRALMKDTNAQPCAYPCLRDGLADWMGSRATQGEGI